MAPDNPAGDGDAGTVTSSTVPAPTAASADAPAAVSAAPAGHPSPLPTPHTAVPQAPQPPAAASGLEPTAASPTPNTTPPTTAAEVDADAAAVAVAAAPGCEPNSPEAVHHVSPSSTVTVDMPNHPPLLDRPGAAPLTSQPTPSHPTGYGTDSSAQAASSTASPAPAQHGRSPSHPGSTPPSNQFTPHPIAPTSQPSDAQRTSHNNSPNAVTLPSMRTIDAIAQQQQQQQQQPPAGPLPHSINGLPPPSSAPGQSYYSHSAVTSAQPYGLHHELSRYPLPQDPRLPGTRGSKKCDEAHPTCNNCKKSKRECLGYDPIFRTQPTTQSGPNLQPAPSPTVALASSNSAALVAGNGRQLNSYAAQPPMLTAPSYPSNSTPAATTSSPTPNSAYHPASSAPTSAPAQADPRYDYSSTTNPPARQYQPSAPFDPARHVDPQSSTPLDHRLPEPTPKMKVSQIIDSLGPTPTPPHVPASREIFSEITKVYHEMYAAALASFFETTWYYFAEDGIMSFPKEASLLEHMASFLKILEAVKANDPAQMAYSGILETRIVWELACAAFKAPESNNAAMRVQLPPEGDGTEARSRLQVVDALLCGEHLPNNPLSPPMADSDTQRTRQFDFWYNLADFIRHRDNPESAQAQHAREEVLGRMRRLLDGRENRDVLYSIAVVRHLAPNFPPGYGAAHTQHLDETDPKSRLAVASKFIMDEAQVTGGMTNVVRRISDIACRAFVNPGFNIAKRA